MPVIHSKPFTFLISDLRFCLAFTLADGCNEYASKISVFLFQCELVGFKRLALF